MRLNRLFQITAVLAVFSTIVGCDEDFSEVGGEIIDNPSNVEVGEYEVDAYSEKINSVQTNNLVDYFLGVNEHPVYGQSIASLITEIRLTTLNPNFGDDVVMDSVILTIPYYSTQNEDALETDDAGYTLDSVYGAGTFKLSVYETNFLLNDLDPEAGFETRQKYYSNQQNLIEQNIVGDAIYVEENFQPSKLGYDSYEVGDEGNDTVTSGPAFRIKLPTAYFKEKIIDKAGSAELASNSDFRDYFRNLFFKAEANGTEGSQMLLNMNNQGAKITLYYKSDRTGADDTVEADVRGSYTLSIAAGNKVNTYEGGYPEDVLQAIQQQNAATGAENIYLKGQEGSMAVIELFPDQAVLEDLKSQDLLVNEANLTFYVNEDIYSGEQPNRLYLYDLTNNTIISDYAIDINVNPNDPNLSLTTFSTPYTTGEDEIGPYYKIRITNYVSNLINNDGDKVKLGVVVVPNINTVVSRGQQGAVTGSLFSATRETPDFIDRISSGTLLTPEGTVFHGNMSSNEDKRLKLRIYYTNFN